MSENVTTFGSGSKKFFALSAMNGFRLVLMLDTANTAFKMDFRSTTTLTMKYRIMNPTLYTNMIRVHPAVDRGIINWAKGTDGRIHIIHRAGGLIK